MSKEAKTVVKNKRKNNISFWANFEINVGDLTSA